MRSASQSPRPVDDVSSALAAEVESRSGRTIGGASLQAVVNPGQGGDIVSLRHIPTGQEVLWRHPQWTDRLPAAHGSDPSAEGFYDGYPGGIQELFPNAGPACVVDDAPLPFHGEACRLPWMVEHADGSAVVMSAALKRYPFALRRTVSVDVHEPVLRICSEIHNLSSRRLPFHWGLHPTFGPSVTAEPAVLEGAFERLKAHPETFGGAQTREPGAEFATGGRLALNAGDARSADLFYARCDRGRVTIASSAEQGLAVTMTWPVEIFPELWIWQECRDRAGYPWFGIHHVVGIEPHTSSPAHGLKAERDRETCRWSEPHERQVVEFSFRVEVTADRDHAQHGISPTSKREDASA